jgi:hypothetical protein
MWCCICCCGGSGIVVGCIALLAMIAKNPEGFITFVSSIIGIAILLPALPYIITFLCLLLFGAIFLFYAGIKDLIDNNSREYKESIKRALKEWGV